MNPSENQKRRISEKEDEKQRLILKAEDLLKEDKRVDESYRITIQCTNRGLEEDAARLFFNDDDTDAERLIKNLHILLEFLFCPINTLASIDLEFLKLRNELMREYRVASLVRVYTAGVYYAQWYHDLGQFVATWWEEAKLSSGVSLKKSWEQRRLKDTAQSDSLADAHLEPGAQKFSKKDLKPDSGNPVRNKRHPKGKRSPKTGKFKRNEEPRAL